VKWESKADVVQLVRVARHIDGGDTTVAVLERHGIDRSVFFPQHETSKAVDDNSTHLRGIERRALARNAVKETQDLIRAVDGIEGSGAFAASIGVQHNIFGQNLRDEVVRQFGKRGLIALSFAILAARMYPTLKYAAWSRPRLHAACDRRGKDTGIASS
jgi:hypothetical protein